jgi:hypothetical protein
MAVDFEARREAFLARCDQLREKVNAPCLQYDQGVAAELEALGREPRVLSSLAGLPIAFEADRGAG